MSMKERIYSATLTEIRLLLCMLRLVSADLTKESFLSKAFEYTIYNK